MNADRTQYAEITRKQCKVSTALESVKEEVHQKLSGRAKGPITQQKKLRKLEERQIEIVKELNLDY